MPALWSTGSSLTRVLPNSCCMFYILKLILKLKSLQTLAVPDIVDRDVHRVLLHNADVRVGDEVPLLLLLELAHEIQRLRAAAPPYVLWCEIQDWGFERSYSSCVSKHGRL